MYRYGAKRDYGINRNDPAVMLGAKDARFEWHPPNVRADQRSPLRSVRCDGQLVCTDFTLLARHSSRV